MRAELAVYAALSAASGVTSLIGTRIYPRTLPQRHTLPALTYRLVSAPRELHHEGAEAVVEARVQTTSHAATYSAVKGLQGAVQTAMDGLAPGTYGGVVVEKAYTEDGPDGHDPQTETELAVTDVLITYREE